MTRLRLRGAALALTLLCVAGGAGVLWMRSAAGPSAAVPPPFPIGLPIATGPQDLVPSRQRLQAHLSTHPGDLPSAVRFSDLALREVRVTGNGGLAVAAEDALRAALADGGSTYEGERMLAAVLLAQHRFTEAEQLASRLSRLEPADPWLQGVLGDAALEQGRYDEAFAAFDRMAALRPDASSYARVAYALELQGQLEDALRVMAMAQQATSPHDLESQAWHTTQVAALQFQLGRVAQARQSYARALHTYPGYPPALAGRADVEASMGDLAAALSSLREAAEGAPSGGWLARIGDLHAARGEQPDAERQYALADVAWSTEMPEPREHALFLASRTRDLPRALDMARTASQKSDDIFTCEALAWAAFVSGDVATARQAIERALRTGTRHRRVRYHAAVIMDAAGQATDARRHLAVALTGHPGFDVLDAPAARLLAARLMVSGVALSDAKAAPQSEWR